MYMCVYIYILWIEQHCSTRMYMYQWSSSSNVCRKGLSKRMRVGSVRQSVCCRSISRKKNASAAWQRRLGCSSIVDPLFVGVYVCAARAWAHTHTYTHAPTHTNEHAHTHTCTHTHAPTHTHPHTHTHTHIHTHTHTHTHIHNTHTRTRSRTYDPSHTHPFLYSVQLSYILSVIHCPFSFFGRATINNSSFSPP